MGNEGGKSAIITGASGLVGSSLLDLLLKDDGFDPVTVVVRRQLALDHNKIRCLVVDFDKIEEQLGGIRATHAYCCLGTTIKKAGDKATQYRIDHDYVVAFARACKINGVMSFSVVSSLGADARSGNFYLSTKGRMEDDLRQLGFKTLTIVRPSLLLGNRAEFRFGERVATVMMRVLSPLFIGSLKRYKAVRAETVASAMLRLGNRSDRDTQVFENELLLDVAKEL